MFDWIRRGFSSSLHNVFSQVGIQSGGLPPGPSSGHAMLREYAISPPLYMVVSRIAQSTSAVEWYVHPTGKPDKIESHPIIDFIGYGTTGLSNISAWEVTAIYLEVIGEAYWVKQRGSRGTPVGFIVLPPTWLEARGNDELPWLFRDRDGAMHSVPPEDIIAFKHPNPIDPSGPGLGAARVIGGELASDRLASQHAAHTFHNHGIPPLVVSLEGATPDQAKDLEGRWRPQTHGMTNRARPFFTGGPGKITFHELKQKLVDMQILESRKFNRDTVLQLWGMPPEILGILESSNRATIEAADYLFNKNLIVPRLSLFKETLQSQLVDRDFPGFVIEFESPLMEDKEFHHSVVKDFPFAVEVNEIRQLAGLEPWEKPVGSERWAPLGWRKIEADAPPAPPAGERSVKAITKDESLLPAGAVEDVIRAVQDDVVSASTDGIYRETVRRAMENINIELGISIDFNIDSPRITEFLAQDGASRMASDVGETTRSALRKTLSEGVQSGETTSQLADRISREFGKATDSRALTIARTESGHASTVARDEALRQAQVPKKEWVAVLDEDTRHAGLDGVIVGVDDNFHLDGYSPAHPYDFGVPEHDINCRCVIIAAFDDKGIDNRNLLCKNADQTRENMEREFVSALRESFGKQRAEALATLELMST